MFVFQQGWVDRQRECKYRAILIFKIQNLEKSARLGELQIV
jgi:hypothetical protein